MNHIKSVSVSVLFLIFSLLTTHCGKKDSQSEIKITNIWSRPATVTGVVYMQISNTGGSDRLLRVSSDIAEYPELHESFMQGDKMKMKHLADGLKIPAEDEVVLQPGGLHIMLINLTKELESGESFELTLHFEKAGPVTVASHIMKNNPKS